MTSQSTFSHDPPSLRGEVIDHARKNWWVYSLGEQALINRYHETGHATDLPFRLKLVRSKIVRTKLKEVRGNG